MKGSVIAGRQWLERVRLERTIGLNEFGRPKLRHPNQVEGINCLSDMGGRDDVCGREAGHNIRNVKDNDILDEEMVHTHDLVEGPVERRDRDTTVR